MANMQLPDGGAFSTNYGGDAYNSAYQSLYQQLQGVHSDSAQAEQQIGTRLNNVTDQFKSSFYNLVGRDPSQDEINTFLSQGAGNIISQANGGTGRTEADSQNVLNQINQFVGQNFHKAAQDYATQQLQDQQTQANSLADLFRQQGSTALDKYTTDTNQGINDTQNALLDYQSKLFDRLRPNLLTSLKAQGLLDTGGLNEAEAGVQGDLANNASQYIAGLKQQQTGNIANLRLINEQGANQIAFGGAQAPYLYKQQQITGQPAYLEGQGNGAVNFNNGTYIDNLNYQHQLGLIGAQADAQQRLQPSFMRTLGQSTAQSMGNQFGQYFSPSNAKMLMA